MGKSQVAQAQLLAAALTLTTLPAFAGDGDCIASAGVSGKAGMQTCRITKTVFQVVQNEHFTPIELQAGSRLRGLVLSGLAQVKQVDGQGSTTWDGKIVNWHERYELKDGCTLINAQGDLLLHAGNATVFIKKGATAMAHNDGRVTRVANLSDKQRQSVRVAFGNHLVDIDPGFELVIVPTTGEDLKTVVMQESIGWRDLRQAREGGFDVFVFRVNSADMMKTCKIYKQLSESPLKVDQDLRDEIVKTAAALEEMFNKRKGPYNLSDPYKYGPDGQVKPAISNRKRPSV